MKQSLDHDEVAITIAAPRSVVYRLVADVTRMPDFSPYIRSVRWLDGASRPAPGVRFEAINKMGRGPAWSNAPVITVCDTDREFAFRRTERFVGTLEWRYRLDEVSGGTRLVQSYRVVLPISRVGWFIIGVLYGIKDDRAALRTGMTETLERIRAAATAVEEGSVV